MMKFSGWLGMPLDHPPYGYLQNISGRKCTKYGTQTAKLPEFGIEYTLSIQPAYKPHSLVCDPFHSATDLIERKEPAMYHQLVEDPLLLYLNPKSQV